MQVKCFGLPFAAQETFDYIIDANLEGKWRWRQGFEYKSKIDQLCYTKKHHFVIHLLPISV